MNRCEIYRDNIENIPDTMEAILCRGTGFESLSVSQVPLADPAPDQILARVDAAGVCTSILKLLKQGRRHTFINGWDMNKWPIILGDEGTVTVVKVGSNLKSSFFPGRRYAIQPAVGISPILHRERYCNNAQGMNKCAVGYSLPGHLAQYILIQEEIIQADCLLELPDQDMPYFAASMAEPISCIYSAQQRNYHIIKDGPNSQRHPHMGLLPGGIAVVIGAGAMGRIHAELALRFKPSVLIVANRSNQLRLDKTEKAIAQKAANKDVKLICTKTDKLPGIINDVSGGKGADDIILSVGVNSVQQQSLQMLADGGVANLFGGLSKPDHILNLDSLAVHYHEIKVVGSSGGDPSDMTATLKAIVNDDIDPGNYVAAVGSLDNAIDVLKMIQSGYIDGKAILYPHIKKTPLQMVDYWDQDKEKQFLDKFLI